MSREFLLVTTTKKFYMLTKIVFSLVEKALFIVKEGE